MAVHVKILTETVANKIAAGEVVERPASVVKELVENSIDAGASDIRIDISAGGRRMIRVSDNGHGMSREDALLSLERHATSKISADTDLDTIDTLGFRGEALPSIASVSRLRLKSRLAGTIEGTEIAVEGGTVRSVTACGMPAGTELTVEQLFYNTPARLKFMRSSETEASHTGELIVRLAISRPEIGFGYYNDGKEILKVTAGDLQQRLKKVAARDIPLFSFYGETAAATVNGYFAPPTAARSTAAGMYTYINNRFIRDKVVQHAIMQAFRAVLEKGRYPLLALFIKVNPGDVDVNVHPTKHEVRFRQQAQVHDTIQGVLEDVLRESPWLENRQNIARPIASSEPLPLKSRHQAGVQQALDRFMSKPSPELQRINEPDASYSRPEQKTVPVEISATTGYFSSLQIICQFRAAYIICQADDRLVIIDQHAAFERVRFEQLKKGFLSGGVESQRLLIPVTLELSFTEAETARRYRDVWTPIGFDLDEFGGLTWRINAVPRIVALKDYEGLFRDILTELQQHGSSASFELVRDELLARVACHSVVRGSHILELVEMRELLKQMDSTDFAAQCPHGRPVSFEITLKELEKTFNRS